MSRLYQLIFLCLLLPVLSGCAAMILSIGEPEQRTVIHSGSTRDEVSSFLGVPIETTPIVPALDAGQLVRRYDATVVEVKDFSATSLYTYRYTGWVQGNYDVGEAVALAGYTLFLSELVMVPVAILMQMGRSNTTHVVKVWCDSTDTVVAYQWLTE